MKTTIIINDHYQLKRRFGKGRHPYKWHNIIIMMMIITSRVPINKSLRLTDEVIVMK